MRGRCSPSHATHALERVQFGRPIASSRRCGTGSPRRSSRSRRSSALGTRRGTSRRLTAALAKALAGRAAFTAARHCQQVLAGIGFTTDHAFHRYFRRILLLDQLFGSAHSLTRELGDELLKSRQLPALLPL